MSLFISALNSGSNGNCYYLGNANEAVLIDVGISCKETEKRLGRLGLNISAVKAIFISHEHTDHISGVEVLARKYKLPVYITNETLISSKLKLDENQLKSFLPFEPVSIGALKVLAFPKHHDASDPHSFIVSCGNTTVGVFTDIGKVCRELITHFKQCNAAFLEANYDEEMLQNGNYPYHLKRRISGDYGHLSNSQALELFKKHKPKFLSHLFLSHLSKENNDPELARNTFLNHANGTKIIVASRYEETALYQIHSSSAQRKKIIAPAIQQEQLSLF